MCENQLTFDEIENEYIDTMIRLAFKQEEALETQEMIAASDRAFTLEEQEAAERVHKRFMDAISEQEKALKKKKRSINIQRIVKNVMQATAVAILVFAVVTSVAIANISSFRSAVMQLLLSFDAGAQELHVDFSENESAAFDVPSDWLGDYYISYIPDGYQIAWQSEYGQAVIEYTNEDGKTIDFMEGTSEVSSAIGTEGGQFTYVSIHGQPAFVIYNEENDEPYFNFTWAVDDRWFNLQTEGLEKDEAIRIAESIKKVIRR